MKIYVASSWKNKETVRNLSEYLREQGHEVFDFTNPKKRADGLDTFCFDAKDWMGTPLNEIDWIDFNKCPATERAFKSDNAGLHWADVLILIVPTGNDSHMEAGFAKGSGKKLYIWGDLPPGDYHTMYGWATECYRSNELPMLLIELEKQNNKKRDSNIDINLIP